MRGKYFLAWLKEYYDVKKLYGKSFVGIGQVFDDFARGAAYENYCYIPRLQDTAEEYGLVKHNFLACGANAALKALRGQTKDELCLIRVNTRFFLHQKRASWREDHYICVDKNLHWINEYPLSEGELYGREFCGSLRRRDMHVFVERPDGRALGRVYGRNTPSEF